MPPRLSGPPDRFLELEPLSYQFAGECDNDWDANWLIVRISAGDDTRKWSAEDPAFLTWEMHMLCRWLRSIADPSANADAVFTGIEPSLQFEQERLGEEVRIRAFFWQEFAPPGTDRTGDRYEIDFAPGFKSVLSFADDLSQLLARFPIRVVEPTGVATSYLRAFEGD